VFLRPARCCRNCRKGRADRETARGCLAADPRRAAFFDPPSKRSRTKDLGIARVTTLNAVRLQRVRLDAYLLWRRLKGVVFPCIWWTSEGKAGRLTYFGAAKGVVFPWSRRTSEGKAGRLTYFGAARGVVFPWSWRTSEGKAGRLTYFGAAKRRRFPLEPADFGG
jgi:hypothetical protein